MLIENKVGGVVFSWGFAECPRATVPSKVAVRRNGITSSTAAVHVRNLGGRTETTKQLISLSLSLHQHWLLTAAIAASHERTEGCTPRRRTYARKRTAAAQSATLCFRAGQQGKNHHRGRRRKQLARGEGDGRRHSLRPASRTRLSKCMAAGAEGIIPARNPRRWSRRCRAMAQIHGPAGASGGPRRASALPRLTTCTRRRSVLLFRMSCVLLPMRRQELVGARSLRVGRLSRLGRGCWYASKRQEHAKWR